MAAKQGTKDQPWNLKTPSRGSEFKAWCGEAASPPALVVVAGLTELRYQLRCLDDLHAPLKVHGGLMPLGSADEQKPAAPGAVESGARSRKNPVGGWYGLKKGLRGRFGNYVPPVMEVLGPAEVEHNPKNSRMRANWATRAVQRGAVAAPASAWPAPCAANTLATIGLSLSTSSGGQS